MNREIKFRAWDKKKKEMGRVFSLENASYEGFPPPFVDGNGECDTRAEYEVMQYTNLHDKNGKEIWEGDIVMLDGSSEPKTIQYYNGGFSANAAHLRGIYGGQEAYRMKVIGNIYENPELLKD